MSVNIGLLSCLGGFISKRLYIWYTWQCRGSFIIFFYQYKGSPFSPVLYLVSG